MDSRRTLRLRCLICACGIMDLVSIVYALPTATPRGRKLLEEIMVCPARHRTAASVARSLGLANRHALARLIHREGLPQYRVLTGWLCVLMLVIAWEEDHKALSRSALDQAKDPAAYSNVVRRVTGLRWKEVRDRGSAWVLAELVDLCHKPLRACGGDPSYQFTQHAG